MSIRSPRSPLKDTIRRMPGQSTHDQIEALIHDRLLMYIFAGGMAVTFSIHEWIRYIFNMPVQPITMTAVAILVLIWVAWQIKKHAPIITQLKLGRDGEREVGQLLSELYGEFKVCHDISCNGFNIDHALVGRTGVFCVETKTRSKRGGVEEKIIFDGEKILVNGHEPSRDPIVQAKANARALAKIILDQTGKPVTVIPIVVFPGWFVELRAKNPDVMVLNPKMLPGYVRRSNQILPPEDIVAINAGIIRHQEHMQKLNYNE